ncbi:Cell division protein [Levilactobacillus brevis]|nr:Cell division protein [Levilactobacillus brevis]
MDENVLQHFRPDEAPLIDAVGGWIQQSQDEYRPVLTNFLNPRQVYIATTLARRADVPVQFNGAMPTLKCSGPYFIQIIMNPWLKILS